jgi:hypothetical protein
MAPDPYSFLLGGVLQFSFTAGDKEIGRFDMKVPELHPGKRVIWQVVDGPKEWIATKIRFEP